MPIPTRSDRRHRIRYIRGRRVWGLPLTRTLWVRHAPVTWRSFNHSPQMMTVGVAPTFPTPLAQRTPLHVQPPIASRFPTVLWLPIELGTDFAFTEAQGANGSSDLFDGQGDGIANSNLIFNFFEADQSTPAAVFDPDPTLAPEPAAWSLLGLGLASIAWARSRRRSPERRTI